MRVIEGGIMPGQPRPIVWNRMNLDPQTVALVIRDAEPPGQRGWVDLAWDDGRPFLVGIRTLAIGLENTSLEAWKAVAVVNGLAVRDERSKPDVFAEADANNAKAAAAARLEAERLRRARKHDNSPLPVGSLFDTTTRDQRGLFGEG